MPLATLLCIACVPSLTSPAEDVGPWDAPDNVWYSAAPPAALEGQGFAVGDVVPEFVGFDQHGDTVSTWQFYGRVTVIDISTMWCPPCQELARGVEASQGHFGDEAVYLTILAENMSAVPPTEEDLVDWTDDFGIESAPVLSDDSNWHADAVPGDGFPRVLVTYQDLTVCEPEVAANDEAVRRAVEGCVNGER